MTANVRDKITKRTVRENVLIGARTHANTLHPDKKEVQVLNETEVKLF